MKIWKEIFMSYRMHIRTKSKISYAEESFFGNYFYEAFRFFNDYIPSIYHNEGFDYWEIPREDLETFYEKLKKLSEKYPNEILFGEERDGYTSTKVYEIVGKILDSTKNKKNFDDSDKIIVEWF